MDIIGTSGTTPVFKTAGPARRWVRAALAVVISGAMMTMLSACATVQPQYAYEEGEALVDEVLSEIVAEMDGPPEFDDMWTVTGECEEEWFLDEVFHVYVFESGSLEDYEAELQDIWTELGYDFDESVTERNGGPYLKAERSDGVYVTLTISGHSSIEGRVALTAYSGCLER